MKTAEGWSSVEVCEKAGCTYRQLDHWVRMGYITSDWRRGNRIFDEGALEQVRALVKLTRLFPAGQEGAGVLYAVKGSKDLTALADAVELAFREYGP